MFLVLSVDQIKQLINAPMIAMSKSQKKWITPQHRLLTRIDSKQFDLPTNTGMKYKQVAKTKLCFLDEVCTGESVKTVVKKLGEPFFIYSDLQTSTPNFIYTYGLKSGSQKLKIQLHFKENYFTMGTISYNAPVNYSELNSYFMNKYSLPTFNILRDIIIDQEGNLISFQLKHDQLMILYCQQ